MNIGVVTVYNSENCGSYWQAVALKLFLEKRGHQVFHIKRNVKGTSHSIVTVAKNVFKRCLKLDFNMACAMINQYHVYEKDISRFTIVNKPYKDLDFIIIGSDTLWNLDDNYFVKNRHIYWGLEFGRIPLATYAISVGNTSIEKVKQYDDIIANLVDFKAISVRDEHTNDVLAGLTNCRYPLVCDPTLLVSQSFFRNLPLRRISDEYIFIYYFGFLTGNLKDKVQAIAKRRDLKIVVMGNSMRGDYNFRESTPELFNDLFAFATYVITNTYHGALFSLIHEKQTIYDSSNKKKVLDILKRFDIQDRDFANPECRESIEERIMDYYVINEKINILRQESERYLDAILND